MNPHRRKPEALARVRQQTRCAKSADTVCKREPASAEPKGSVLGGYASLRSASSFSAAARPASASPN
eukprot:2979256-Rhodomonas_salina.2